MGLCSSSAGASPSQKAQDKRVDDFLKAKSKREARIQKLLLLGAGESGKSTMLKQMIKLYGVGFSVEDLEAYKPNVCSNTIAAIRTLIEQAHILHDDKQMDTEPTDSEVISSMTRLSDMLFTDPITPEVADHISRVWHDPHIQRTYEQRNTFQLFDSAAYFFERVHAIAASNYVPSEDDVMRCRVRTTGIVETHFNVDEVPFQVFDVGGQRNERKKWIHCFDNVTVVLFVAAVSEYDQVLYENNSTNRMEETLALFEEIANMSYFKSTSFMLFLNKYDLLKEKVGHSSFTKYDPNFTGDEKNVDEVIAHIEDLFVKRFRTGNESKQLYVHVTTATDSDHMKQVFTVVKDIIIRRSLLEGGLN